VRYAENIKAYPIGRYIDPNNSRIMHEGHSIYRVETTAKWNLHPNEPVPMPRGPFHIRDSARTTSPVGDELVAQLNQQKEATREIMQGGEVVSQKLGELSGKLQQTQEIAAQNSLLKQEMNTARQRLDALEEQLRAKPPSAPSKSPSEKSEKPEW
jgi:polyhydroxyalkanoate synthesis regulator phasin